MRKKALLGTLIVFVWLSADLRAGEAPGLAEKLVIIQNEKAKPQERKEAIEWLRRCRCGWLIHGLLLDTARFWRWRTAELHNTASTGTRGGRSEANESTTTFSCNTGKEPATV